MDQAAFTDLIRQHIKLIHKVSSAYCANATDRDDVVQEIVAQLWRSRHKYDGLHKLSTWIYRIALNVAISFYRRESKHNRKRVAATDRLCWVAADLANEPNEAVETLGLCIQQLDELNRALVLLYLEGNDHATIADVLGITVTNVATKLSRLKKKLRSAFEAQAAKEMRT